ncbi:MAG: hypothetical protein FWC83_00905, partial [Alphaproteobacteria bacterium]|nr:hypothetical protein [Alphaproteobacteria bacterium]
MKKLLTLGLALGLVACGGSSQNALREGRAPRQQNAIFIAKMELDPAISDRFGEKRERDRRHLEFALATTRGDGTNINDRWNNRIDTEYTELPTNEFFAIEVRPGNKLAIRSIGFRTEHRYIPVFGTQHIFTTSIRNPSFKIDTVPEAGTAYYIGTIRIE